MALIHWVASSFLPEKSAGRAALSSEGCKDMGGAMGAKGTGPAVGAGVEGCSGWGFQDWWGQVAEVRMFSIGTSSLS